MLKACKIAKLASSLFFFVDGSHGKARANSRIPESYGAQMISVPPCLSLPLLPLPASVSHGRPCQDIND
jgi:hypothetical protein